MTRNRRARLLRAAIGALMVASALAVTGCGMPVPGVLGKNLADADLVLRRAGFRVGTVDYSKDSTGVLGEIIDQDPKEGRLAKDGAGIDLTVAGPPPVPAPDVVGMDKTQLTAALAAAGLNLGAVSGSYDNTIPLGIVISQKPKAGDSAQPGSEIEVVMSQGHVPIAVPKVVKMQLAKATALLEKRGWIVEVTESRGAYTAGQVLSQDPAPSALLVPGETVRLVVSAGADVVRVPNIEGKSRTLADKTLKDAGLVPSVVVVSGRVDSDAGDMGNAYRQQPGPGTVVSKGAKVAYRIWR